MMSPSLDFESSASTNSATSANFVFVHADAKDAIITEIITYSKLHQKKT